MSYLYYVFLLSFIIMSWCPFTHAENSKPKPRANLILQGGLVVDTKNNVIEKRDLYICDGLFVDKKDVHTCEPKIIDISGKWVIKAPNDMHVHARGQQGNDYSFSYLSPKKVASLFTKAGVLRYLDAMQDEKTIFPARDDQREHPTAYEADIFCAGGAFTPTLGHGFEYLAYGVAKTALHVVDTPQEAIEAVDEIALKNPDVVKIMYDHRGEDKQGHPIAVNDGEMGVLGKAMSKPVMEAIVKRSIEKGLRPYVHIGTWDDARDAINAGAKIINHLGFGAIPDELLALIKQKKIYWIPTLTVYSELLTLKNDPYLLDDELLKRIIDEKIIATYKVASNYDLHKWDLWFQNRYKNFNQDNIKKLFKAGATFVVGSDTIELGTFWGWSTHREMLLLVDAGLSPWDALQAATSNAEEMLDIHNEIAPGSEANILVLNASPIEHIWNTTKIHKVIHRGVVIHSY